MVKGENPLSLFFTKMYYIFNPVYLEVEGFAFETDPLCGNRCGGVRDMQTCTLHWK
jgi:hypothetical protein